MLDDIRDQDASPTKDEREWMAIDAMEVVVKSVVLAAVAVAIGISATLIIGHEGEAPTAAATSHR